MKFSQYNKINRVWHRSVAIWTLLPFLLVATSGILLQVKRWIPSIQPESMKSSTGALTKIQSPISWEQVITSARTVVDAQIKSWDDIKSIDVRPVLGVARVRSANDYEVQIDLADGKVLSAAKRYTGLLVQIHEGSFFGPRVRNFVFLPTAVLTLLLALTGAWLAFSRRGAKYE